MCAGNHYAIRNAKVNKNFEALKVLVAAYGKNNNAKKSYDRLFSALDHKKDRELKQKMFNFGQGKNLLEKTIPNCQMHQGMIHTHG